MANRRPIEPEKRDQHVPVINTTAATQIIDRIAQIQAEWKQSHRPIQQSRNNR